MKFINWLGALCFLQLIMSSLAFAQNTSTATAPTFTAESGIAQGIRVAFVKPALDLKLNTSAGGHSESHEANIDETNGISVGYAAIPVQSVGFIADLAYLQLAEQDVKLKMFRASGSATYGLSPMVYVKGGLNISNLRTVDGTKIDPFIGLQAGVGFQVIQSFGLELNYVVMNQKDKIDAAKIDFEEKGAELALTATF